MKKISIFVIIEFKLNNEHKDTTDYIIFFSSKVNERIHDAKNLNGVQAQY